MSAADLPFPDLALTPATRLLWRAPDSIQIELAGSAVVVDGLPAAVVAWLAAPPGAPARPRPRMDARVREVLTALTDAGYLWPRASGPADPRVAAPAPRLAGQLTSLVARHGEAAADVLNARRYATVEVTGRSRLVAAVAAVLAAAGIGHVHCAVDGATKLHHLLPGGATPADESAPLAVAAEAAVRRAAPDTHTAPLAPGERPDLTILAAEAPVPDERLAALHAAGAPYLAVRLGADFGVVGPLVVPGRTSCPRCADRHRRDRDPAWDALAVQLTIDRRPGPAADVAVATTIAGVTAQQALAFLDGGSTATMDGTLELHLPDWRLRRRSWSRHPACACAEDVPTRGSGGAGPPEREVGRMAG
jgi:bacteriocin biosynthesis cyclodehydratase domain-containing protein